MLEDDDFLTARAFILSAIDRADANNLLAFSPDEKKRLRDALLTAESGVRDREESLR